MRQNIRSLLVLVTGISLLVVVESRGQIGCRAKTMREIGSDVNRGVGRRRDYKELYNLSCACPCEQYPQNEQYGACSRCGHYYRPIEFI